MTGTDNNLSLTKGETIAAVSTPPGSGGIAVIRVSGPDAIEISDKIWRGKRLATCASHTVHLGEIVDTEGEMTDTAVATIFRAPHSFTGEDTVEFAVHGSPWIQREVVSLLVDAGARPAEAGEFTRRAFVNGRLDLAQAEGVADMIAAASKAAGRLAARQMKGDFSRRLNEIREEMVTLASLMELELDFSEEDVEFADRTRLRTLCESLMKEIDGLAKTFRAGRAIKEGVNVVIAGCPNAGKSTLLNRLLGEEKAIVSDIAGTTRDVIEDTTEIEGVLFRLVDTAGLRDADDTIERLGIERALRRIENADIIIYLLDATEDLKAQSSYLNTSVLKSENQGDEQPEKIYVLNKTDESGAINIADVSRILGVKEADLIEISAKEGTGIEMLEKRLAEIASRGIDLQSEIIVTNARHYDSLLKTREALSRFLAAMIEGVPADFLAQDLREAIHHLGEITGAITTDTLLQTIFSRFCIGK